MHVLINSSLEKALYRDSPPLRMLQNKPIQLTTSLDQWSHSLNEISTEIQTDLDRVVYDDRRNQMQCLLWITFHLIFHTARRTGHIPKQNYNNIT